VQPKKERRPYRIQEPLKKKQPRWQAPPFPSTLAPTDHAATAISTYSIVHAGPKIHAGGFQNGFCKPAYQPAVETKTPVMEAATDSASQPAKASCGCLAEGGGEGVTSIFVSQTQSNNRLQIEPEPALMIFKG
jgi:hypothetical protein